MTTWKKICLIEELPIRGARTVNIKNLKIGLFRVNNGEVFAVENECPHHQGPLVEGLLTGNNVICPLHNWKINLETGQVQIPDSGCVKTFNVKIEDGFIWITC